MQNQPIQPIILAILDGWGHSQNNNGNAIKLANTPTMDSLWKNYPHSLLSASGQDVGLPHKQMGNSEVGHTTIGAGRVIDQDLVRIARSIENQDFFHNDTLKSSIFHASKYNSKIHLIGLCSDGGVHSHIDHLIALLKLFKKYGNIKICIHIITDGRDTKPNNAKFFIQKILDHIMHIPNAQICTISGRYYSMDRDCRWSRTEQAYRVLANNSIHSVIDPFAIIDMNYAAGIFDEFIPPTRIIEGSVSNDDALIFFNFRPDRTRQIVQAFAKNNFKGFSRENIDNLNIVTFTQYDSSLSLPIVFPPQAKRNFLGEIISKNKLKQLRLSETEKYAHVTYFFNGGIEEPFPGEDRELIPSPQVNNYDETPSMSAKELTKSVIKAIKKQIYQLIIINYANPDMVGHTGNLQATIDAIECIDKCILELLKNAAAEQTTLIITADHGNAEYMLDSQNKPCKSHSTNPVPFIVIPNNGLIIKKSDQYSLHATGSLTDIAPTILHMMQIEKPSEMGGKSLIKQIGFIHVSNTKDELCIQTRQKAT